MRKDSLKKLVLLVLALWVVFSAMDVWTDYRDGASSAHFFTELGVFLASLAAMILFFFDSRDWKADAERFEGDARRFEGNVVALREALARSEMEAQKFREANEASLRSFASAVDSQFFEWRLSQAEREIASHLIKGLSLKEIAELREASERTVRSQAMSIYEKSGLDGRAALSAFFLEGLFSQSVQPSSTEVSSADILVRPEISHS